ncbi:MAG: histidine kinase [Crocinitomicaceae bacterium]|nr:histidine kinase [Crocinitomicaceae bacterium]
MILINSSWKKYLLIASAWWLFWVIIVTLVIHRLGWPWRVSAADASLFMASQLIAVSIIRNTHKFYHTNAKNISYRIVYLFVIALIVNTVFRWISPLLLSTYNSYGTFLSASFPVRFVFSLLMIALLDVMFWLSYFTKEQESQEKRKKEIETLFKDAELARLHLQLQPHFLFNSLNSISALTGKQPEEARKMIQQLSDFLRGTIKKGDQQLVSMGEELHHIELYLDIEKVRFGDRLKTDIRNEKGTENLLLPSLLLQPIVENAIKFGLYNTTGEVAITICATIEKENLLINIRNPFDSGSDSPHRGTGFGLNSIQRRLYLLYARNDLLNTHCENGTFTTSLLIPQQK